MRARCPASQASIIGEYGGYAALIGGALFAIPLLAAAILLTKPKTAQGQEKVMLSCRTSLSSHPMIILLLAAPAFAGDEQAAEMWTWARGGGRIYKKINLSAFCAVRLISGFHRASCE